MNVPRIILPRLGTGSIDNLTDDQKELLRMLVDAYEKQGRQGFVTSNTFSGATVICGGFQAAINPGDADILVLDQEGFVVLTKVWPHSVAGKVTQRGIEAVKANFAANAAIPADDMPIRPDESIAQSVAPSSGTKHAPCLDAKARPRGRGFSARGEDHQIVYKAATQFGDDGDDLASRLPDVCRELQRAGALFPGKWKEELWESWEEVADDIEGPGKSRQREKVSKYISYRVNWVRTNSPHHP